LNETINSWQFGKSLGEIDWGTANTAEQPSQSLTVTTESAVPAPPPLTPQQRYALSYGAYKSITTIADIIAMARIRVYVDDEEVQAGPAFDVMQRPAPGVSPRALLNAQTQWWLIAGEMASRSIAPMVPGGAGWITPLCPLRHFLEPVDPYNPETADDVKAWQVTFRTGQSRAIHGREISFDANFNPVDPFSIRGIAPLAVLGLVVDGGIGADRFSRDYIRNGARPATQVNLGQSATPDDREAYLRQFKNDFSYWNGNAGGVLVTSGSDKVSVDALGQAFDDSFIQYSLQAEQKCNRFWKIPGIVASTSDNSRHDTSGDEIEVFTDFTLGPISQIISEHLSRHLSRQYDPRNVTRSRPREQQKPRGERLERALAESKAAGRRLTAFVDLDEVPIIARSRLHKIEHVQKLREATMTSPHAACAFVGLHELNLDDRPERKELWQQNNIVCITKPEINKDLVPGIKSPEERDADVAKKLAPPTAPASRTRTPAKPRASRKVRKAFARDIGRLLIVKARDGEPLGLSEGDAIAEKHGIDTLEVRRVRSVTKSMSEPDVKAWLKTYQPEATDE
jgi:hypothetical protein